ncbi:MAG TPA: sigma-70 family RNA polymerase sigma factor [Candidatus Acidoferrales bacterium]|nr:sigma-70 family RNA polymerase sigma factor [Candidatus Acidoferrales bacterium]
MAAAIENIMVTQAVTKLEEIFRAHQVCVLKAAYRVTGSMADAEDVSQSVFLRLARGTFDSGRISNMESYLRRSAVNAALDLIRSRGDRETVPVETAHERQSNSSVSPERAASSLEINNWLRQQLAKLNPRAAEMFALRYLEGLDNPEIARTMGTSQAVVAVTLHRTRARLKKSFHAFGKGAS